VLITAGGALPVAYQIFRMGYYGLLTPNTAVAKDASTLDVHQGLVYLSNFLTPYRLWMPVVLLVVLLPLAVGRRLSRTDLAMCAAAVVSGLVMAAYVVAIGGDFMHARMLLPATFAMLLPFMALPVPRIQAATLRLAVPAALCLLGVFAWALTCGASWRMTQKPAVVPANGIADERAFWVAKIHEKHPDAGEQYVLALEGYGDYTAHMLEAVVYYDEPDQPQLLYSVDGKQVEAVPLNRTAYTVGAPALVLGTAGSATPLDGLVVDQHGLSYGVGAHVEAQAGLRVGHNKYIDLAWIIAEYSDATSAPGIPQPDLAAARKALGCSALVRLQKASTAPLTFGQFWTNVFDSPSNTSLRFSNDPVQAERQLCR
jgi:arabinofuranosyltransferase